MMRGYRILIMAIGSVPSIFLCGGCSTDSGSVIPEGDARIALLTTRGAGNTDADYRPVFLFWRTSDVINISASPYAAPFYVAGDVPEDAKAYETVRYNTQQSYPTDFSTLLATGYIPRDLVPAKDGSRNLYHQLTLPASGRGAGRTDLMAPRAPLTGSLLNPFDASGQQLVFKHLQSRVNFRAICDEEFPTSFYVDKVQITVEASVLAGGIRWDPNIRSYVATASSGSDLTVGHGYQTLDGETLPVEVLTWYDSAQVVGGTDGNEYSPAGDFYVLPNRTKLTIKQVSCRMYPSGSALTEAEKDTYTKTARNVAVEFVDGSSQITLREGESHEITLYFAQDGIELSGRKMPWSQGGNIIIPVEP